MTIQEFIQAAIEGKWEEKNNPVLDSKYGLIFSWSAKKDVESGQLGHGMTLISINELLLDPKAWEAVGKVKGWGNKDNHFGMTKFAPIDMPQKFNITFTGKEWQWYMLCMIEKLIIGKTLEEYISTL